MNFDLTCLVAPRWQRRALLYACMASHFAVACADVNSAPNDDVAVASAELGSCAEPGATADFYKFTGPLPDKNGTLLKCERLLPSSAAGTGTSTGYRVLYRTSTQLHSGGTVSDVGLVASGIVYVPNGQLAAGAERPVVANTHGAMGVLPACGPSLVTPEPYDVGYLAKLTAQLPTAPVIAVPDYLGLGMDHGMRGAEVDYVYTWLDFKKTKPFSNVSHPFVSLVSEGRATVDIVRATRELPGSGVPASPRWFAFGQSQGGHAAISAAEVVKRGYDADMRLLGVVAGAPASELDNEAWWSDDLKYPLFAMMVGSLPLEWRDLRVSRFFNYTGMAFMDNVTNARCYVEANAVETIAKSWLVGNLFGVNPWQDTAVKAAFAANSPGRTNIGVPLFVGQVRGDPVIAHQRTGTFVNAARLVSDQPIIFCEYYGPVDQNVWPGLARSANHDAFKQMFSAIADRRSAGCSFDGAPEQTEPADFVARLYTASGGH